jgi:FAD/FMN-containing dehydrogenase
MDLQSLEDGMSNRRSAGTPHRRGQRPTAAALNDVHARLNPTRPAVYRRVGGMAEVFDALAQAERQRLSIALAGGRHAMGGQQFLNAGCVLDLRGLNRILDFDQERGFITVEAGATWPELMRGYLRRQAGGTQQWGLRQKQTGADALTIGGAISANIHGRGLIFAPFSMDVESLQIVTAGGELVVCSRRQEPELFRLAVGGYGLFGIIVSATLRLVPRQKVQRVVQLMAMPEVMRAFETRIQQGYTYGDFQFSTDPRSGGFLRDGVFSCYRPVEFTRPIPPNQIRLSQNDWGRLLYLAHVNKRQAFMEFADFYLRSSGQIYWNDTHQLNIYLDDYHRALDERLEPSVPGTEMITELYVPCERLFAMMEAIREDFLIHGVDFIYGTIRLIRKDSDAFLRWAKQDYACVIFNLHVDHCETGLARARANFRRLIDRAIEFGGSYFLTYHRYATRGQVLSCYPEFPEFLRRKRAWDPKDRFASDWYLHHRSLLAEGQSQ